MLYAIEASGDSSERTIREYWRETPGDAEGRPYADEAVRGVSEERERIDEYIVQASENWRLDRMTRVDRNILRLGTYELLHQGDVPRAVILDESVELAKRYGTEESGKFVNGVLERIATVLDRRDTPMKSG